MQVGPAHADLFTYHFHIQVRIVEMFFNDGFELGEEGVFMSGRCRFYFLSGRIIPFDRW